MRSICGAKNAALATTSSLRDKKSACYFKKAFRASLTVTPGNPMDMAAFWKWFPRFQEVADVEMTATQRR